MSPPTTDPSDVSQTTESPFRLTMLDVWQGLSILVESDGHYMLYDGGGKKRSSYVVSYLKEQGITTLDYLFASHYDEDHIAGLVGVMNIADVRQAVTPDYTKDTKIFQSFRNMLDQQNIPETHPAEGDVYSLGNAQITVLNADNKATQENNRSTVVRITYGDTSCIITGDAEFATEANLVYYDAPLDSDLYVVGHHGSSSSSMPAFLDAVDPDYAFISVGKNSYGHPTLETLQNLADEDCRIFRTDKQQEVTFFSDGENIWFDQEPWIFDPQAEAATP
ncbi:MAG: MBL fold metallo-hydrolase [Lachnospiraceae bacterium]|nr:MBL fold metallo-hydrolase [Lachnospiraceae bacterium]